MTFPFAKLAISLTAVASALVGTGCQASEVSTVSVAVAGAKAVSDTAPQSVVAMNSRETNLQKTRTSIIVMGFETSAKSRARR